MDPRTVRYLLQSGNQHTVAFFEAMDDLDLAFLSLSEHDTDPGNTVAINTVDVIHFTTRRNSGLGHHQSLFVVKLKLYPGKHAGTQTGVVIRDLGAQQN